MSGDLAKFYGGRALKGTAKQKAWAEKIREGFLKNMEADEAVELVTCGGFLDSAKFWIDNKDAEANQMKAQNVVSQYNGLVKLRDLHRETLARTGEKLEKEAARKEIKSYTENCTINLP